jgi:hypothetical protein
MKLLKVVDSSAEVGVWEHHSSFELLTLQEWDLLPDL